MRRGKYVDMDGRQWAVLLPDGTPDGESSMGIPVGPPSLEPLGLPLEVEVRLHNQLFERELLTEKDVRARRTDVVGAIQAAFKVDAGRIVQLYAKPTVQEKPEEEPRVTTQRRQRRSRKRGGS